MITQGQLRLGSPPPIGGDLEPIRCLTSDLSSVRPGDIFLARDAHGDEFDAEAALSRGALGVVVAGRHVEPWAGAASVQVDSCHAAVERMASWNRDQFEAPLITIAGPLGKSTVCAMLDGILRQLNRSLAMLELTTKTLSAELLSLTSEHKYAVAEVNCRPDAFPAISALCRPTIAVITSTHNSLPGRETSEGLIEFLQGLPNESCLVLNGDDPKLRRAARHSQADHIVLVGRNQDSDVRAENVACHPNHLKFEVDDQQFEIPIPCRSYLSLALAAVAVGQRLEVPLDAIANALASFKPLPGRCHVRRTETITTIDNRCGSAPEALFASLEMLKDLSGIQRRVVVVEVDIEDKWLAPFGDALVTQCGVDALIVNGGGAEGVAHAARTAGMPEGSINVRNNNETIESVWKRAVRPGDGVLVISNEAEMICDQISQVAKTLPALDLTQSSPGVESIQ